MAFSDKPIPLAYATLKELLLNHVKCTNFECRKRVKFHKTTHQNNQKVKGFILGLQKQAAKWYFGNQIDVQLRDRLVVGINIPNLERKLIQMPKCSFQYVRTVCNNYETVQFKPNRTSWEQANLCFEINQESSTK